jgi:hypothetical protein
MILAPRSANAIQMSTQVSTSKGMTRPSAGSNLTKRSMELPKRRGMRRAKPIAAKKLTYARMRRRR